MKSISLSALEPISGIYKITNIKNGKVYIGQSVNVTLRWWSHVEELSKGKHCNKMLSEDFQQYGLQSFTAEIIERCGSRDKNILLERERYYISLYFHSGYSLYNRIDDRSGFGRLFTFVKNGGEKMYP